MPGLTRRSVLGVALGVQGVCAVVLGGNAHPDEVHQYLEPAHRLAFGYGNRAHEWYAGMRNLAAPGAIAGLWRAVAALGVDRPGWLLGVVWAAVALGSLGALGLVHGVVARRRPGGPEAVFATLLLAVWVPWQDMAFRTLGETLSVTALVVALGLRDRGRYAGAGFAAGAAFVLRYPAGLFVLPFCVDALRARSRRDTVGFFLGLGAALGGLGALDAMTWGAAFHSVRAYAEYNLVRGQAAATFGTQPWWWYGAALPLVVPAGLLGAVGRPRWRDAGLPGALSLVYLVGMSLVAHKEPRFAVAAAPFALVAAVLLRPAWSPRRRAAVLALTVVQSAVTFGALAYRDRRGAGVQRATWGLHAAPDLAALWVMNRTHPGLSALHRDVPLRADPRGRLAPTLRALDAEAGVGRASGGRVYALCDAYGDAPEGCVEALRGRGFVLVGRRGAVTVWAR